MKKIILILFLFLLCIVCYFIYYKTQNNKLYVTSTGDFLSQYQYIDNIKIKTYNQSFATKDLKINDLLNMIKYNPEKDIFHQTLAKTDILILSIGMNDIYYKLNSNSKEIYTYLNNIINTYEEILLVINKYSYKKVYILGYYNVTNQNNDIFDYINYKLAKITNNYNYTFLDLNQSINHNPSYLKTDSTYHLNEVGYKYISSLIVENLKKYDII